jgi:hypothetical protein
MAVRRGLRPCAIAVLGTLAAGLLGLLGTTWRTDRRALGEIDRRVASGERLVVAFWHENYLPLIVLARGRSAVVVTATSFRGEVVGRICRRFGHRTVAIDPGQGPTVLDQVATILGDGGGLVALAVDGPLGPLHRPKPGAIRLARRLGAAILPMAVDCGRALRLAGRWDRMMVPLPLAEVRLLAGETLPPPWSEDAPAIERLSLRLADALDRLPREPERHR